MEGGGHIVMSTSRSVLLARSTFVADVQLWYKWETRSYLLYHKFKQTNWKRRIYFPVMWILFKCYMIQIPASSHKKSKKKYGVLFTHSSNVMWHWKCFWLKQNDRIVVRTLLMCLLKHVTDTTKSRIPIAAVGAFTWWSKGVKYAVL